ncbi:NAD(P)H-binding protein [Robertkochia sediminum]|uniref:NAD(P)H-binding protein n=1 Tax=Robertkochia sediminum TaxID=2785326 RepID=UPI001934B476|nr:NAD(P)H-binding protein [Robertkochia sediminum]MBL7473947.1 NAD(P)H-binding protein [Robertkochia sediminum]
MTRSKNQIAVLGCGWLGLPLAEALIHEGYTVKGSTTRESKMTQLSQKGITPFCINAREGDLVGPAAHFLENCHILIINIPPGLRKAPERDFTRVLVPVLDAAENAGIRHILYISSTSVFPDREQTYTETDPFEPDTRTGRQLQAAEHLVMSQKSGTDHTVLRFGGLLGGDRHPVTFLSGRNELKGANNRINLIHRDDCIRIILGIITKNLWGYTLHGVAPCHSSKKAYYTHAAEQMQLSPPQYSDDPSGKSKLISTAYTDRLLEQHYLHPLC